MVFCSRALNDTDHHHHHQPSAAASDEQDDERRGFILREESSLAELPALHQPFAQDEEDNSSHNNDDITFQPLPVTPSKITFSTSVGGRIEGNGREEPGEELDEGDEEGSTTQLRSISAMDVEEVSCLLREQDADLLERHQSQTPNNATPQLSIGTVPARKMPVLPELVLPPPSPSKPKPTLSPLPVSSSSAPNSMLPPRSSRSFSSDAALASGRGEATASSLSQVPPPKPSVLAALENTIGGAEQGRMNRRRTSSRSSMRDADRQNSVGEASLASVNGDRQASSESSLPPSGQSAVEQRPTLGGLVYEQEDEILPESGFPIAVVLSSSIPVQQSAELHNSGDLQNYCRTENLDRRLCEAAQFAEAVGDAKVAEELQILEEDRPDEDDEDDEDETAQIPTEAQELGKISVHSDSAVPPLVQQPEEAAAVVGDQLTENHSVASSPLPKGRGGLKPAPYVQGHHKKRFMATKRGFLDQLPTGQASSQSDYCYKGLRYNPADVIKRGIQRGNYAQLHRKAWLEVSDKYHRYGKNLRFYYRHWETLGCPTNMFFDWLDSKGEAAGQPLPEIEECPRSVLDSDTVEYISDPEVTENYALVLWPDENGRGRVVDIDGDPVTTGSDGWIFVLRDNRVYGAEKITSVTGHRSKQRFHHSSFFGGKAVAAAGIFITDEEGYLKRLYPHSGHYRPREAHMQRVLFFLHHQGVDLRTFDMDMQQIVHVAREKDLPSTKSNKKEKNGSNTEKKKKVESLLLMPAVLAACFLAHKARFIGAGVFEQIHQIRKANVTSVTEALDLIDDGGYW